SRVGEQLEQLGNLRDRIDAGQVGAVEVATAYSTITDDLLGLDSTAVAGIGAELAGDAHGLHHLHVAGEEVSVQQAIIGYGIDRGSLAPSEFESLRTSVLRMNDR